MSRTPHFKPKPCCDCGSSFVPSGGRQVRCPKCGKAAKTKTKAHHDPRPCKDCMEEFIPKNGAEKYCKRCRLTRKALGSKAYAPSRKDDEVSPALAGARPGDFEPPTGKCSRCSAVVRLSRTEEWQVITKPGAKHGDPADRLLLCRACWHERNVEALQSETLPPDAIFDRRQAAVGRCAMILLALDKVERAVAWAQISRAVEGMR